MVSIGVSPPRHHLPTLPPSAITRRGLIPAAPTTTNLTMNANAHRLTGAAQTTSPFESFHLAPTVIDKDHGYPSAAQ